MIVNKKCANSNKKCQKQQKTVDKRADKTYICANDNKITKQNERKWEKVKQKEKQIIENFAVVIPRLSEADKSYLLGLGEGMAMKVNKNDGKEKNEKE